MKCEQIAPLLDHYQQGALPSFKRAWVFQHLAGCEGCRERLDGLGRPASTEPEQSGEKPAAEEWKAVSVPSFRRRRSRAARWLVAVGLLTLTGGVGLAAWLAYEGELRWPIRFSQAVMGQLGQEVDTSIWQALSSANEVITSGRLPMARWSSPDEQGAFIPYEAAAQNKLGVTLRVQSVEQYEDQVLIHARFDGRNLLPPGNREGWVQVYDSNDMLLSGSVESVLVDRAGISVHVSIPVQGHELLSLHFQQIGQEVVYPWRLELPDPPERLYEVSETIAGFPSGLQLERYGIANHLLSATVSGPFLEGLEASPRLYLQDATGYRIAPQEQQFLLGHDGKSTLVLQYPVPRSWKTPLWLVGDGAVRKNLGSWTIDVTMIK